MMSSPVTVGMLYSVVEGLRSRIHKLETREEHSGPRLFTEGTEPNNAPTDGAFLFVRDNGSGKTQLCVRYATGVSKVLDTEL